MKTLGVIFLNSLMLEISYIHTGRSNTYLPQQRATWELASLHSSLQSFSVTVTPIAPFSLPLLHLHKSNGGASRWMLHLHLSSTSHSGRNGNTYFLRTKLENRSHTNYAQHHLYAPLYCGGLLAIHMGKNPNM